MSSATGGSWSFHRDCITLIREVSSDARTRSIGRFANAYTSVRGDRGRASERSEKGSVCHRRRSSNVCFMPAICLAAGSRGQKFVLSASVINDDAYFSTINAGLRRRIARSPLIQPAKRVRIQQSVQNGSNIAKVDIIDLLAHSTAY